MDKQQQWDLEIRPRANIFVMNFAEIWRYRDLLLLFVRRDFVALYKQTILGPLWHFVQPVLTSMMFLVVFTGIARLPTDGIHPIVFYMSGLTVWNYFSMCLTSTSNTFLANASIFGKVYFPRIITPLSVIISNLIRFGIQFLLLMAVMVWYAFEGYAVHVTLYWLLIPVLLLMMAGIALGVGILISALTTKYRDFSVLLTFAIQLLMYGTPVVYPLSYLQQQGYGSIAKLNPLTPLLEAYRYILFGKGMFQAFDVLYSVFFMIAALIAGLVLFNRIEKNFIDTI